MLRKVTGALSTLSTLPASAPDNSTSTTSTPAESGASSPLHGTKPTHADGAHREQERELAKRLNENGVPTSLEDCRTCNDPCFEELHGGNGTITHASFPRNFDVDWESDLLGSAKPSQRTIVVSTGKSNWPHDHTEDESTLSHHINKALEAGPKPRDVPPPTTGVPGLYTTQRSLGPASTSVAPPRTGLFSSSAVSQSALADKETVMVFPDWVAVTDVDNSDDGAKELIEGLNSGALPKQASLERKAWTLPYRAVVLLCSHKQRDKRCHIAAPLLEKALVQQLEARDVQVDLKGEALACDDLLDAGPSLSDVETPSLSTEIDGRLRTIPHVDDAKGGGQVGIFRISHLGGHRYAGVMIICFPSGAQLYYGRVSPHEIEKVVEETILGGQVLAGLLRAGGNVLRERSSVDGKPCENRSILSW